MTKKENRLYRKHYRHWKGKMGIFWFNMFKKNKPIEAYGFWIDAFASEDMTFIPSKLPYDYVIDIFCDIVARSKVKHGKEWKTSHPEEYFNRSYTGLPLETSSRIMLKKLLEILRQSKKESGFFGWYREMSKLMKVIY